MAEERLHLDEPKPPPGMELEQVVDDDGDDLTEPEHQALHETLLRFWSSAEAGKTRPASELLEERRRRAVNLDVPSAATARLCDSHSDGTVPGSIRKA